MLRDTRGPFATLVKISVWSATLGFMAIALADDVDERPLQVELTAHKVQLSAQGDAQPEQLVSAERAEPGDVIQYTATYANQGSQSLRNVVPLLPIPVGMTYMPSSASPDAVQASVDGRTFANVPLMERFVDADGRERQRPVPYERYRYLRWKVSQLDAGTRVEIGARVQVNSPSRNDQIND